MSNGQLQRQIDVSSQFGSESAGATVLEFPMARRRDLKAYGVAADRKWEIVVLQKVLELVEMPSGWDSYGAPSVGWDTGLFALWVLHNVMRPETPIPHVVPSSVGGIQIEWHERDIDLELHIAAPYECELWFQDHRDPAAQPISVEFANDLGPLERAIAMLSSRS